MKASNSLALADDAIAAFWRWFSVNRHEIEAMLDRGDTDELTRRLNGQINELSPQLAWEMGPGLVEPYMLVFPAEGDSARKNVIEKIMQAAPQMEHWELHASRPTRPFPPEVQLPDRGLTFRSSGWRFGLKGSATSDRLDLDVFDDELADCDEKTALTAVFILLDAVLGEDIVERWIGRIRVMARSRGRESLPMPSIAEHLAGMIPG